MKRIVRHSAAGRSAVAAALTCLAIGCSPTIFAAQDYPVKPIRLVVTFPAGGPSDASARNFAQLLSQRLVQQIIIDNRPGASGTIGTRMAARAAPDGYTLLYCSVATHSANVALFPDPAYDPVKDFTPIVRFSTAPFVLLVNPSLPVRTLGDLTALAKAQPGRLRYGSAGVATFTHIIGEVLAHQTGMELIHVPYKGSAPAVTDAIGGHIDMVFTSSPDALPQIKAGRLRALAITGPRRLAALPEVPTMAENGVTESELLGWGGLCAPSGTPQAVIGKLNAEAVAAYLAPNVKANLELQGYELAANTPEEFAQFIKLDIARTVALVKQFRIRPE
jgi:tripartite-type tricarboxylate transporter receptor subunit TctC